VSGRRALIRDGTRLSYVDFGGAGAVLVALHGHFGCARNFAPLAAALAPGWRVLALDQRGHGWSHRPRACDRASYVADVEAFLVHLDAGAVPVLGHSLGGVNAYQVAARRPDLVSALVIEDVGFRIGPAAPGADPWPRRFETLSALMAFLEARDLARDRHFLDSVVEYEDGWGFRFDPAWVARSREALIGDWWADWVASLCPALLLRGSRSWVLTAAEAERMAAGRPDTTLIELAAGHAIHDELPGEFAGAVADFLGARRPGTAGRAAGPGHLA
jgi:esterase